MKYDHPEVIEPALEVIRRTDPDIYRQMTEDDTWDVHVITRVTPAEKRLDDSDGTEYDFIRDHPDGEMITSTVVQGKPTDALLPAIRSHLKTYGAPLAEVVAADLVHEFMHHHGGGEMPAYQASYTFASKLPHGGRIAENSRNGMMESMFEGLW